MYETKDQNKEEENPDSFTKAAREGKRIEQDL
jgi:hypothetical protein